MSKFVESLSCLGQTVFYVVLLFVPIVWRFAIVMNRLEQIELTNENFKEVFKRFASRFIELLCLLITHLIISFKLYNEIYEDVAASTMSETLIFLIVVGAFVVLFIYLVGNKGNNTIE